MFPSDRTGLRARLRDSVDLLVDFATLGEYRLQAAPGPAPEEVGTGAAGRPSQGGGRTAPAPHALAPASRGTLAPATVAARQLALRRDALQRRASLSCQAEPRRPLRPRAGAEPVPASGRRLRARAGTAAPAEPVPCLTRG
jgi:hypothetical protein